MVKDILIECLTLLDDIELKNKIQDVNNQSNIDDEIINFDEKQKDTIKLLLSQTKNVINSVTKNYLKNYKVEKVLSDNDGKIYLRDLSKPVQSIKNVSDVMNNYIVYKTFYDHLKVPFKNQEYYICYNFETTSFNSLFDSVDVPIGLSTYIIALGVVSAFMQIKLLYSEAEVFESKFKAELQSIKPNTSLRSFYVWRS